MALKNVTSNIATDTLDLPVYQIKNKNYITRYQLTLNFQSIEYAIDKRDASMEKLKKQQKANV